jgi:uncharacterized protein YjbJ (UPF0337 family)
MNKDEFKGKVDNMKGRVKEAAGSLTGNKEKQAEGTVERVGGAAREKVGEIKREFGLDEKRPDEKRDDRPARPDKDEDTE